MTNRRNVLAVGVLGGMIMAMLALAGTFGSGRLVRAESAPLALDIYTADAQGIGVTSTLIYGETEAILVDTQFRISDADKVADRIAVKGRRLKAILITHPHFDHFYGATVLLKRFPGTPVYASAADVEYIKGDLAGTVAQIRARYRSPDSRALRRGDHSRGHPDPAGVAGHPLHGGRSVRGCHRGPAG